MNIVHSAHARQILDLLIGYKISPILWKHSSSSDKTLSAGRCQTPALRIIYENELERLERLENLNENENENENTKVFRLIKKRLVWTPMSQTILECRPICA